MTTKITLIFDNPTEPYVFEDAYGDLIDRAQKVPGVLRMEPSEVWPKEDCIPTPTHGLIDLYPPDYVSASTAVATPEAAEFLPHAVELASDGARAVFAEIEEP